MTDDEYRNAAAELYAQGHPIREICQSLKLSYGKVHRLLTETEAGVRKRNEATQLFRDLQKGKGLTPTEHFNSVTGVDPTATDTHVIEGDLRPVNIIDITSRETGVLCDVHAPFHALYRSESGELYGPYMTALQYLKDRNCGTVLLNGDFMDCYQLSRHEKIEKKRDFFWELDVTRGLLLHLRQYFGDNVRIIYREGNHEERLPRLLATKLPELHGLTSIPELLRLSELGIEWVGERDRIRVGSLWIDHGHEWFGSGGVNPARAYRMKAGDNVMVGHVHRTTYDNFKRPLDGTLYAGWSVGCLCDLNPHYAPRNAWNHGCAVVTLFDDGEFMVDNRIIFNNRIR